ncbi:LysR family transcriptional regulator [Microbacterium sp. UFMG61]|uniref:LysR family transcriptional regulator n=1 Tax=Microbacterium sp. UFMG61 TaxID=2745935 RepID=UPI0018905919
MAEELHFGHAAERLHMSQPPLSQAIKQLERDVGTTLLERSNRRVSLTPAGEAFLTACRRLVEHAQEVADIPRVVAQGFSSQLSIGAVASALRWPLPQAIALLRQSAPGLTIRIHEIDTDEVIRALNDGKLDVAVARLAASRAGIRTRVILREEFVLITPSTHPSVGESSPIDLASLSDEQWVGISRDVSPDYHDEMAAAFRAAGFSPRMHHIARSIASQVAMVAAGAGISIVPRSASRELPTSVSTRATTSATQTVTLAVSTREDANHYERLLQGCIESVTGAV